jgi:hypothetical protein
VETNLFVVGRKIDRVDEQAYAASKAILRTRKSERMGTARGILDAQSIWSGAPLPTL